MSLDDVDLVLAARSGDRAAWAGIYDRYADRLHDFCWSVLRDRDAAADAMQDTFITAYRKLDQLRDPTRLRSWLFAIARNEALGGARRRSRAIPTEDLEVTATTAGPADSAQTAELRDLVWAAAAGLADRDRAALDLHLRQGLEGAALGEALGTSANNANVLMSRLRDQVERSLGAYLVAKKGRSDCAALEALLQPWDGEFTPLWRKRIARHVEDCPTCDESRRRMVSPMALLAGVAVVPAPAHLRDRVLNKLDLISTTTPIGADTRDRRRRRIAVAAMVAALLLLLAGLTYQMTNNDSPSPASLATATTLDLLPPTSNGPTVPTSPAGGGETTLTTRRPTTATTTRPGGATPTTAPAAPTTLPPPTTVPLSVSAQPGTLTPSCGTPAQLPVGASVSGGRAPYRVTAGWNGPGGTGADNIALNPSGSGWRGNLTFSQVGEYTWWVTVRDASGAVVRTGTQSIRGRPLPPIEFGRMPWVVDTQPSDRFPIYSRGNVGEVFPTVVTPLTGTLYVPQAELGFRDGFAQFGALRKRDFGDTTSGVTCVANGYTYLNASFIRVLAVRTPGLTVADIDRQFFGESDAPPYNAQKGDKNLAASLKIARTLLRTLNAKRLPALEADKVRVAQWIARLPETASATDAELIAVLRAFRPEFRHLFGRHILTTFQATIGPGLLAQICEGKLDDPTLPNKLLAGIGAVESAAPSAAMWELSRLNADSDEFKTGFATFLHDFGSRGPNEWEGSSETWGTNPALALAAIDRMRGADATHDPRAQQKRLEREREAATRSARSRLRGLTRMQFDRALRSAHVFSQGRERSKTTIIRALHGVRLAQRELAKRAQRRGATDDLTDLWMVTDDELEDYVSDPAGFASIVAERKRQRDELNALIPPFVFDRVQPPPETWARRDTTVDAATAGTVLTGIAGCPGIARGRARVVLDPGDPRGLGPGEVLVAPITDPSWTPLFVAAEAVVVEVGAQMSHAVIVSRELGIPAVVSVTGATQLLPDGALIEVNGDRGTVTVLDA